MASSGDNETALVREIMKALKVWPWCRPMRRNAGKRGGVRMAEAGTPDIEVMVPGGRVVWLEAKTPGGVVSGDQRAWHAAARSLGHRVHVVRSVDEAVQAVRAAQMEAS